MSETGIVLSMQGSVEDVNASVQAHPDVWVWCLHCERLSQAKELKVDFRGALTLCPHRCDGSGMGIDIYPVEADRAFFGDAKVPAGVEFRSGLRVPLYPKKSRRPRARAPELSDPALAAAAKSADTVLVLKPVKRTRRP